MKIDIVDDGLLVVGLPVGSLAARKAWADELATKVLTQQKTMADVIINEDAGADQPRMQMLITALRQTGVASFIWAARGLPPEVTEDAASRVDNGLLNIVLDHLNLRERFNRLNAKEQAYAVARFNASKTTGGLALGGASIGVTGAYLAGLASLMRTLKPHYPRLAISQIYPDADALYQRVREIDPDAKIVADCEHLDDLADGRRRGTTVQLHVSAIQHRNNLKRLKDDWGDSTHTANVVACQGSASAALDAHCRFIESRLTNAEIRTGVCRMLGLPLTDDDDDDGGLCACGANNPRTGEHAYLCAMSRTRQEQATDGHAALAAVLQTLPSCKLVGNVRIVTRMRRPAEPTFQHAADHIGVKLAKPADAERRFDVGVTVRDGGTHYIDCMNTATIQGANLKQACQVQGHAVEAGENDKLLDYSKSISNLDDKRRSIWFAVVDNNGTVGKNYTDFIKHIAKVAYPGSGNDGRYDVDGLRSRCVARLRVAISCGVWRAGHKAIEGWLVDNNKHKNNNG